MQREIVITEDGSTSLFVHEIDEYFHSHFGAIQESEHIFIRTGLLADRFLSATKISILEIGFGTGLNCYLTYLKHLQTGINIIYEGIELFPLNSEEYEKLNYAHHLGLDATQEIFLQMHQSPWNQKVEISDHFILSKRDKSFELVQFGLEQFDLVYFDAFSPDKQPEMWNHFAKIFDTLKPGGVLVTYCTKGIVKRALKSVGFSVEKLPGPKGKREILRAYKS